VISLTLLQAWEPSRILVAISTVLTFSFVPLRVHAAAIKGTITGTSVTAPWLKIDPNIRDDKDTATTM